MDLNSIVQFLKKYKIQVAAISLIITAILIIILVATLVPEFVDSQDEKYCNLESCGGKPHTLCTYPDKVSAECGTCKSVKPSEADILDMLELHNDYRRKVGMGEEKRGKDDKPQPPHCDAEDCPKPIPPMEWDDELARIAQRWLNQCKFEHDKCRDTPDYQVGQNIGYSGTSIKYPPYDEVFFAWTNEVEMVLPSDVKKFGDSNHMIGHYTQVVWEESTKLGCGFLKCHKDRMDNTWVICNYGPAGNVIGEPIYATKDGDDAAPPDPSE